jgi:hypothetical protein
VRVGVFDGVAVGVEVGVDVAVGVGVSVAVGLGVTVGVSVRVSVGSGASVRTTATSVGAGEAPHAAKTSPRNRMPIPSASRFIVRFLMEGENCG